MHAIITYLKHVREEFAHIVWPSRETAIAHTLIVVVIAAVMTVLVGMFDFLFGSVVARIIGG